MTPARFPRLFFLSLTQYFLPWSQPLCYAAVPGLPFSPQMWGEHEHQRARSSPLCWGTWWRSVRLSVSLHLQRGRWNLNPWLVPQLPKNRWLFEPLMMSAKNTRDVIETSSVKFWGIMKLNMVFAMISWCIILLMVQKSCTTNHDD